MFKETKFSLQKVEKAALTRKARELLSEDFLFVLNGMKNGKTRMQIKETTDTN